MTEQETVSEEIRAEFIRIMEMKPHERSAKEWGLIVEFQANSAMKELRQERAKIDSLVIELVKHDEYAKALRSKYLDFMLDILDLLTNAGSHADRNIWTLQAIARLQDFGSTLAYRLEKMYIQTNPPQETDEIPF